MLTTVANQTPLRTQISRLAQQYMGGQGPLHTAAPSHASMPLAPTPQLPTLPQQQAQLPLSLTSEDWARPLGSMSMAAATPMSAVSSGVPYAPGGASTAAFTSASLTHTPLALQPAPAPAHHVAPAIAAPMPAAMWAMLTGLGGLGGPGLEPPRSSLSQLAAVIEAGGYKAPLQPKVRKGMGGRHRKDGRTARDGLTWTCIHSNTRTAGAAAAGVFGHAGHEARARVGLDKAPRNGHAHAEAPLPLSSSISYINWIVCASHIMLHTLTYGTWGYMAPDACKLFI